MSDNTEQTETKPLDPAMARFYESLPPEELNGESPSNNSGGEKQETTATTEAPAEAPVNNGNGEGSGNNGSEENKGAENTNQNPFDVNKYLEESSGGLFKSEEDYKSSVSKIKDYEDLRQKYEALQSDYDNVFADDSIKKLNALKKAGKSDEQIASFTALSKMDLANIDPKEALIQHEVLNNGHPRALAERIVNRTYRLNDYPTEGDDLTPDEIQSNKEELETIHAEMKNVAKPIIAGFQKELEGYSNVDSPEQKALDEAARKKSYEKALEPFAQKLTDDFPKKISFSPAEGVDLSYDIPEDFIASVKEEAMSHFNHPDLEVNNDTVNDFLTLKKALYVYPRLKEMLTNSFEQGKALGEKTKASEFENSHGLTRPNANVEVTTDNIDDTLIAIAKGK